MPFPSPSIQSSRAASANQVGSVPTAAAANGVTVKEFGVGVVRQTVITLTDSAMTITDALAYASQQIYDFPAGNIRFLDCVATITMKTTSAIASTLNSGATISWGVGTAAASSLTLATTMMNAMPGSGESVNTFTSSTTINVAAAADTGILSHTATARGLAGADGTGTPVDLYLNIAVPTNTEIDADATVTITGTITITWTCGGDI
jgi:hypothetical protein